ncbi:MAG: NAD(P)H-binding protein [Thermoleophilaceae bacterium]
MKALVTGATGFVGGRLARQLMERGTEVRALVRSRDRASDLQDDGAELHEGDVTDCRLAARRRRGRGRGLLPGPRHGPRLGRRLRGARAQVRAQLRPDGA